MSAEEIAALQSTLAPRLPNDGMREVFAAAIESSAQRENRLRGNTFAMAMRELMTDILHTLAPDDAVRACVWYVAEADGRPTRVQRQTYVIQGGLSDDYVTQTLELDLGELRDELRDAFGALNRATHVRAGRMINTNEEVDELVTATLRAVDGLLNAVDHCRKSLLDAVADELTDEVMQEVLRETIQAIDEKAGHHTIEYIWIDETEAVEIDAHTITYRVTGSIDATLEYGSSSDFRKGDGATIDHNFPYECVLKAPVADPQAFEDDAVLVVQDGGWYD